MKLFDIYRLAVQLGLGADPRSRAELEAGLRAQKGRFEKLGKKEKGYFDKDLLWNPYHDSRLLYGDEGKEVKSLLFGIDVSPSEILIADRLREKGKRIDAVVGHHPHGKARGIFHEVMHVQEDMYHEFGVPINVIEDLMAPRIREAHRAGHAINYNQSVDAARLLDIPFMCLHAPCDMLGQRFVQDLVDKEEPKRVSDVIDVLMGLPELDLAAKENSQPDVWAGERGRRAGRVLVKFAGGTAGPKEMYEALARAGVGTVVCMHVPENHIEEARKAHVNVVISSHMASDSIGINLFADRLEDKGVNVEPFSGLIRVRRN